MTRLKSCPACAYPRPTDLRQACPRCGHAQRDGSHAGWRAIRAQVLARDRYRCQLQLPGCTGIATHADHIIPLAQGGADDLDGLQAACSHCNLTKSSK